MTPLIRTSSSKRYLKTAGKASVTPFLKEEIATSSFMGPLVLEKHTPCKEEIFAKVAIRSRQSRGSLKKLFNKTQLSRRKSQAHGWKDILKNHLTATYLTSKFNNLKIMLREVHHSIIEE